MIQVDREALIEALKREKAGYAARGLTDRVALVDEQLALLGAASDDPSSRERAVEKRAARRERRG